MHSVEIQIQANWQRQIAEAISSPAELGQLLQLPEPWIRANESARSLFPMRVPRYFASLMEVGNSNDPLLLQIMPKAEEFADVPGYSTDPLIENAAAAAAGLLHKYGSRVLLIFRGGCAVNCRYCFRRHFPYENHHLSQEKWQQIEAYLQQHPEVNEVILSGGDPLMANDAQVMKAAKRLAALPQIKRLRIHSRLPIVIPDRLTAELAEGLANMGLQIILVLHANHANEITATLQKKLAAWRQQGITVLNQSVLLAGVNDSVAALTELSEALFAAGVLPYYLHQLDKVSGAAHFAITDRQAKHLHAELLKILPGFLVPKLVREIAGEASKTPL
jgi:EF-P beta-lysylation protein EpmB